MSYALNTPPPAKSCISAQVDKAANYPLKKTPARPIGLAGVFAGYRLWAASQKSLGEKSIRGDGDFLEQLLFPFTPRAPSFLQLQRPGLVN
jgi:hypothetical protein